MAALAAPERAGATVTVTDNGNGTVTLANQLISVVVSKTNGGISSIISSKLPGVNMVQPGDTIGLELTHIGAGPQSAPVNDYWTDVSAGGTEVYSVAVSSGTMVDIQIRNPTASPDLTTYPNGLWDWSIHHVMFDNDSGFYTYHVWRHTALQPESYWSADSWQGYTNGALFAASPINMAWDFSGVQKMGVSIGDAGSNATNEGVPGEVNILPLTNYFTQPTGQNYEPNWPIYTQPTGLTYELYPTWSKYDWPTYLGPYTSYRNTWGVANDLMGIWHCNGSNEWRNGGPTKLSGAMSGDYMYEDDDEGHGLGPTNTTEPAGSVYEKMIGPFFTYVNSGTNHNALWADAQARGAQEVAKWPYAWVNESESDYNRNRGTVTGQITAITGQSTANAVVILGLPQSATCPDWIWQGCTNYLYWTTADANGNFTIPKVDPGTYTLYSYVPGIFASGINPSGTTVSSPGYQEVGNYGEYTQNNITVTANATTNLGTIAWSPPRAQSLLFQIGIPDRSTEEFRFGDLIKQFGLWWRYDNEMGTNTLNFNVGTSNVANNWYYAQPIFAVAGGSYFEPLWNINFNLSSVPTSPVTLTVNLAGGYGTTFYAYVNNVNETPSPYASSGIYTSSGADIYRDVVQIGQWQQYIVTLPSSAFKTGSNTVQLRVRQGGFSGTWNTSGGWPDLVAGGLMYDAIKLEAGALSTQIIQNGTYKIGSGLNGFVAQVENNGTTSGTPVVEYPFEFLPDEEWAITDLGNDVYSIIAVNSGMALSVQNASTAVNAPIVQAAYTGATSQQWHAILNTSGGLSLINVNSGLALDITGQRSDYQNNVQLIQNTSNNGGSQSWFETPQTYGPPPVPLDLTATAGNGQVSLAWTASERATGYTIMRGTSTGNETTTVATNVSNSSYTDTGATNGATYYYVVVATTNVGGWGASPNSNEASTTPAPPVPLPPANLIATVGNGQATLSWGASANASTYTLMRSMGASSPTGVIAAGLTGTNYTDPNLTDGVTYNYVLAAVNLSGTSGNSNEASVIPTQFRAGAPSGLTALSGNGVVALSWTPASGAGAASYIILRGTASGTYNTQFTVGAPNTSYLDASVTNGVTYYYVVEASNSNGVSANSNEAAVAPASNPPAAPTGLTATGSNQLVSLAWKPSTGATGYTVLQGTSSGSYTTTVVAGTTGTTCIEAGLTNGTPYYFAVFATGLGGTSAYSTQATATPSRPSGTLIWLGNTNTNWDTSTPNWQYGGSSATFQNGDSLVLGDSGNPASENLYLYKSVTPGSITVNVTNLNYGIAGVGSISGTAGITFNGNNNSFTMGVPDTATGPTVIQSGTLILQGGGSVGSGKITFNNGTLAASLYGGGGTGTGGNTFNVPAGETGTVVMGAKMSVGAVTGSGTMNITDSGGSTAAKADNLCGTWGGSFTGPLNLTSNDSGGFVLTGYFNGGNPDFDGNLGNTTVNMNDVGICSWDSSGGNTITFGALNGTSTASIVGSAYAGGMTVSVGGLNTNSVFAGSINNTYGGGNTALVKTGTGSLTLSGSCAYAGATSVNKGNLTVNGMISGSGTALTVASGASLGGTGSIAGTVTVNSGGSLLLSSTGNLAVNGNVTFGGGVTVSPASSGLLATGTYTLLTYTGSESGTPSFTYVPPKGVNQSATFNTSTPGQIAVSIAGPPPAPTGLTLTPGNSQVGLSWTASPTATSYLITRGTSSGSETVTVSGTDTSTTFTDIGLTNGLTYYYVVTSSNSFGLGGASTEASAMPGQTFGQWIAAAFPGVTSTNIIGMTAQPEGDGVPNLMKYFMGINPAASGPAPLTCALDGQGDIVLYFRMSNALSGVSYSINRSTDLISWTSTGRQGTVVSNMGTYSNMKVIVPMAANAQMYLELSVSSP
jgi:autotransporter-associated beta strand protein